MANPLEAQNENIITSSSGMTRMATLLWRRRINRKRIKALWSFALFLLLIMGALNAAAGDFPPSETTIWFDTPAENFTQSVPLGNGRLGAMVLGGVDDERIILNESSVWSGSCQDADRPDAWKILPEIRRLLVEGKNVEAEALVSANFTCKGPGSAGGQYGCYQVLGNLHLSFYNANNASFENYRRSLDLQDAVMRMQYTKGAVTFTREAFVSAPDQAIILHLTASEPAQISFDVHLDRPERFETSASGQNELLMTGQLDNGLDGKGVRYAARMRVLHRGGEVFTTNSILFVRRANEATLLITAATDYRGFAGRQIREPAAASLADMNAAASRSVASLRKTHAADYRKYFDRVSLQLEPADAAFAAKPTPERIQWANTHGGDPALAALYFNFGRYLLISSSRPGGLPPNLQGIWAEEINTPWKSDWHLDVNVEMNYWPAEACNLSDLTGPLFALTASLQEPGAKTARAYYHARGWVAHMMTNPWGFTSPGEDASWGVTAGGSAWLCQHLWDHWLFTHDKRFLGWAYPILKGAARFYSDMLIEDTKHHYLAVAPANSPENRFILPDGRDAAISLGTTVHAQMLRYLFTACIESSRMLGTDEPFRNELIATRARLSPTPIGLDGRVMEWPEPYKESEPHHRHISHLWGLYPGDEISPETTPGLAQAARKTLETRGDDGVGWALANKAALWARLEDGNHAWLLVRKALQPASGMDIRYDNGGGVYPNLFDASPPFQIDGNFGVTAAVAEMLLQSQKGPVHLLPALPRTWKNGKVSGLRARGGFTVDMAWENGRLTTATIRADKSGNCHVEYAGKTAELSLRKGQIVRLDENLKRL